MTGNSHIGARVKKLRSERMWSQEQLADLARVSARTIQRLESQGDASPHTLRAVAGALAIEVQQLTAGSEDVSENPAVDFIARVMSGKELCDMIAESGAIQHNNDELETEDELEMVSSFIQEICDISDIWNDMEPRHQVETAFRMGKSLRELEQIGFSVFAQLKDRRFYPKAGALGAGLPWDLAVVTVLVMRSSNPAIVKLSPTSEALATVGGGRPHRPSGDEGASEHE